MKAVAPGKLILSGEHAVVYGAPALAMAIDRSAHSVLLPGRGEGVSFDLPGEGAGDSFTLLALEDFKSRVMKNYRLFLRGDLGIRDVIAKPVDLFKYAFIMVLDGLHYQLDSGLCLQVRSTIPMGCGLGSSAATVLSEIRALGHYFRVEFRPDWYYDFSLEAERMQHGRPSGVDSYISLHGGCARFREGRAESRPLPRMPMYLVETGVPQSTTGECVEAVAREFAASSIWSEFAGITEEVDRAVLDNDPLRLRAGVRENHRKLVRLGVVPEKVGRFVDAVEARGGAAKICGAGAVRGEAGGVVLVLADEAPAELCREYGYTVSPVRGDPLGTRMIG
ncbi:mevalonate kinase [Kiritimatiella glycovorans]|uniref:mevalonate kinase n=1 Tax=Kiritimatiella glycovorans TaxID=1307763 RepID=A0A0G3EMJ6_9BACT|nr:hypothetical protein [Kiritimatiella glycovorans]AKJ65329.1 putative mevalonate kinase [Kiritimatiella glycovorans]